MAETMIATHVKSEHSTRKNKKPLMEKRRRARINSCLSQLKSLVLQAIKKDSSQFSKLEKADILELTVKHLRALQRQQAAGVMTQDPNVVGKYRAGFNECAKEVVRYMGSVREVNEDIKDRVLGHLAGCLQVVNHVTPVESMQQQHQHQHMKPLHVHIPQQQQSLNAGLTTITPSVIMQAPPQTSMHSGLNFSPSPIRSSSSPDCQTPSPSVSATPLSALPMASAATTAATTVVSHNPGNNNISRAFKIVPSTACPSGAVALYLGGSGVGGGHRSDTVSVDAVPLYSVSLPHHSEAAVTAFVPPPPSSTAHSQMVVDCRLSSSVSPVSAESYHHVNMAPAAASLPVDLRQAHKVKAFGDSQVHSVHHGLSFGQCSPASMADEKLWRPW